MRSKTPGSLFDTLEMIEAARYAQRVHRGIKELATMLELLDPAGAGAVVRKEIMKAKATELAADALTLAEKVAVIK